MLFYNVQKRKNIVTIIILYIIYTSSCARSACFATSARISLLSLCHYALQLILCVVE